MSISDFQTTILLAKVFGVLKYLRVTGAVIVGVITSIRGTTITGVVGFISVFIVVPLVVFTGATGVAARGFGTMVTEGFLGVYPTFSSAWSICISDSRLPEKAGIIELFVKNGFFTVSSSFSQSPRFERRLIIRLLFSKERVVVLRNALTKFGVRTFPSLKRAQKFSDRY